MRHTDTPAIRDLQVLKNAIHTATRCFYEGHFQKTHDEIQEANKHLDALERLCRTAWERELKTNA